MSEQTKSDADERLKPMYRCKTRKPDGSIVDGCGWQGTETLRCPSCGSHVLRGVAVDRLQHVDAYQPEARAVDSTGVVTRHGAAHLPGLGNDAAARKAAPMARGVLFYFPNALAAVANLSKVGNEQHNPGQPMHWAFDKSSDEPDCILRHLAQSGTVDTDGILHSVKVAWRALAMLERELLAAHPELQPGKSVRNFKREP